MNASAPDAKKSPDRKKSAVVTRHLPQGLRHWLIRIAIAVAVLSLIGYFSNPSVSPLMCKIYG